MTIRAFKQYVFATLYQLVGNITKSELLFYTTQHHLPYLFFPALDVNIPNRGHAASSKTRAY